MADIDKLICDRLVKTGGSVHEISSKPCGETAVVFHKMVCNFDSPAFSISMKCELHSHKYTPKGMVEISREEAIVLHTMKDFSF